MKAKEFIVELFSQPLPYRWKQKNEYGWTGNFVVPGEPPKNVTIQFSKFSTPPRVEVAFLVNGKFEITGGGHALEIFSTVNQMFDEYVKTNNPPLLVFSADINEPSRVKLYNRIAKGLAQKYNYSLETESTDVYVYFKLKQQ